MWSGYMKKIAIIGSQGYIGRNCAFFLHSQGVESVCYDISVQFSNKNYRQIDMTDKASVSGIDMDVDCIYFFTGLTGTYAGFDQYEKYNQLNELTLLNLLSAIKDSPYRPKVVFPSSRLVYKGAKRALREDDEKEAKTVYAANKLACEYLLQAYSNSFDIPFTILRIGVPFGNLIGTDYSFGTVGRFMRAAADGCIRLYGNGMAKRTFTEIGDLCSQIFEVSQKKESVGEIYNVGGTAYSLFEVANIIAKRYGATIESVDWPAKDEKIESGDTIFDSSKIERLLCGQKFVYKTIDYLFSSVERKS